MTTMICNECSGTGLDKEFERCDACDGRAVKLTAPERENDTDEDKEKDSTPKCKACHGKKKLAGNTCPLCRGTGDGIAVEQKTADEADDFEFVPDDLPPAYRLLKVGHILPILFHLSRVGFIRDDEIVTTKINWNEYRRDVLEFDTPEEADSGTISDSFTVPGYGRVTPRMVGLVAGLLTKSTTRTSDGKDRAGAWIERLASHKPEASVLSAADGLYVRQDNEIVKIANFL